MEMNTMLKTILYIVYFQYFISDLCTNEVILRPMAGEMNRINGNHQTIMLLEAFFFPRNELELLQRRDYVEKDRFLFAFIIFTFPPNRNVYSIQ